MSSASKVDLPDHIDAAVLKVAGVVVLGAIMSILDITVVNVALPTFQTVFGTPGEPLPYSTVAWTVTGLHPRAGHGDPDDRLGGRPVRHQAALPDRHRAVHDRLGALRDRVEHRRPDRLPGPAGARWRHAHAARHDDHDPGGGTAPDGPADGDPRRADAARPDPRPHHRRLAHRGRELALDLPDQRADRPRRDRLRLAGAADGHPGAVRVVRLPRHGAHVARAGAVPVRRLLHPRGRDGHRPKGLGPDADRHRADGRASSSTRSARSTRCSTCGCSGTATSRSRSSRCSCSPRRSSAGCCWCRRTSSRSAGSRR